MADLPKAFAPYAPAHARLLREIDAAMADRLQVVAILDPASFKNAWTQFGALAASRGGGSLFAGTSQAQDPSVAPLILPLQHGDTTTQTALACVSMAHPAVVWLASPLRLPPLIDRLTSKLDARLADGGRPLTLRYYDPRSLAQLLQILDSTQQRHFNDGVRIWWWLDRRNDLGRSDPAPQPQEPVEPPPPGAAPIALNNEQVDALLSGSFADRVINVLLGDNPSALQGFDRAQRYALADALIADAATWQVTSEFDCAFYIAVVLQKGQFFAQQDDWAPAMAKVKAGTLRFSDAVALWSGQNADRE